MDSKIVEFFETKKAERCKKKQNASMTDQQKAEIVQAVENEFSLDKWLPDAAKRAGQISVSTHPCTFTHPGCKKNENFKTSSILATSNYCADGFLRSGNLKVEQDALGNAAVLDVYKFLSLQLENGLTLLEHIEKDSEEAKSLLSISTATYEELKKGFMAVKDNDTKPVTSSKLKQVYFPVNDSYHQLSILQASGIIFEMKKRIGDMQFGDETKEARKAKKDEKAHSGYKDFANLHEIGYGGANAQNISVLNAKNNGRAYLLESLPPILSKRIRLPKKDFFDECIWTAKFRDRCLSLHKLFVATINNINIRNARDNQIIDIFYDIVSHIRICRKQPSGWTETEKYNNLPPYQCIILDEQWKNRREDFSDSVNQFLHETSRWIQKAYKSNLKNKAITLADEELLHFRKLIAMHKEVLF